MTDIKILNLAKGRMKHSAQQQSVVADNIARSDLPGAKPSYVKDFNFKSYLSHSTSGAALQPSQTNPAHLSGTRPPTGAFRVQESKDAYEVAPDGNAIVLEEQLLKAGEARREHNNATVMYKRFTGFLRQAVGSGGN